MCESVWVLVRGQGYIRPSVWNKLSAPAGPCRSRQSRQRAPALPGLGNQWLVLLKDTALVSLIGVNEMMRQAQMASASTYEPFTWYAAAALIYLAISLVSEFGLKQAARYTRRYGG